MDNLAAIKLTREMLETIGKSRFIKAIRKRNAMQTIMLQPFFGRTLPQSDTGFVKFRRPITYVLEKPPSDLIFRVKTPKGTE